MDYSGRISIRSAGQFDAKSWLEEGDGLLASSAKMREIWEDHRRTFTNTVEERKRGTRVRASDWKLLMGLPRGSMLLLGYSVEMYLKAGLVKAYRGCCEKMFEGDVRGRYGHNMVFLAEEIGFPFKVEDRKNLNLLRDMVIADARYPVFSRSGAIYANEINRRTGEIWKAEKFGILTELANRVEEHARNIDADRNNPALCKSVKVDDDGYITFRIGGNLPPRITYRLSSVQKCKNEGSLDVIKALLVSRFAWLSSYCERAWIYEDGEDKNGKKKTWRRALTDKLGGLTR